MSPDGQLAGFTIGITADRRGEDQEVLFRRLGAEVVRGPMMRTIHVVDRAVLRERTEQLVSAPPDVLVANTGTGMRSWFAAADEWGLLDQLRAALEGKHLVARGPKAAAALSSVRLQATWKAPSETLNEVTEHLLERGVKGRLVAYQLHGDDRESLSAAVVAAGATVIPVPVYRWSLPTESDASPALELIDLCCAGEIDAVTFTAGPQVRNMMELADAEGRARPLLEAFNRGRPLAACIGPVCASSAREEGIDEPIVPDNWRLGSLVKLVASVLAGGRT